MEDLKRELTLLLLYLNSWEEKDFIFGSYKTKSVTLSEEGIQKAQKLLEKYYKQ